VHRLHTLGATYLTGAAGEPLAGAATQRRTLALLALLTASDAGLSRDKLVAFLWPESDAERARHSLTQALYAARRALQIDDLFVAGASDVRLNPDRLTSDVREFEDAIASGELEHAVTLYEGPFLDGFYLSGSPEFEQWAASQRARLESRVADALDRLSRQAETAGDLRRALDWRRRLAALLPLDAGHAVNLMTALAAVGDRAGAVQHARVHAALLRDQLDLAPDPVVEEHAETMRAALTWPAAAAPAVAPGTVAPGPAVAPTATAVAQQDVAPLPAVRVWVQERRPHPSWLRWAVLAVSLVALLGLGALIGRSVRQPAEVSELPVRQRLVVAPFRVAGADPTLRYLRDGMVELLSTRLADDTSARSVDAGAVLGAWRAAGLTPTMDVPRETVVRLAARLGAERVVVGSVVGTPSRAVLSATLLQVPGGEVSAQANVSGPADSITTLIDRLAARLLVSEAGQDESLAHYTSRSLPALKSFLTGQAAFRRHDYPAAMRGYEQALRRDSSFALAALYRALAADRLRLEAPLRGGVSSASAARADLNARDAAQLIAIAGPRFPALSSASELTGAWQRVVDLAPVSADAWYALASRLLLDGAPAAVPAWRARAVAALQRALAADPDHLPSRQLLAPLAGHAPATTADAGRPGGIPLDSAAPLSASARWHAAAVAGDTAALRRARGRLSAMNVTDLRVIAMTSQLEAIAPDDGVRALSALRARAGTEAARVDVAFADHSQALNEGRIADALEATQRLRRLLPGQESWLRLQVLDALYGRGDSAAGAAAATRLAELTAASPLAVPATWDSWLANACVASQWRLARRDTTRVRATIEILRSHPHLDPSIRVSTTPLACAELLDAGLAVVTRRDARAQLTRVGALVFTPQVAGDAATYAPLLMARLFEAVGDPVTALSSIRRRGHPAAWPRYIAAMWREEGRLAALTGDGEGARAAYEHFLRYRNEPSAAADSDAARIRGELARLTTSP
jgi:DNA-binding SARP family transcriptional activator